MVYVKVTMSGYSPIVSGGEMLIFSEKNSTQRQPEWRRNASLTCSPQVIGLPVEHMNRMSGALGFNVLRLGVYYKHLLSSYTTVLERMPRQVRERRYPEFVNRMSNRQKINDIARLFVPFLLDMFLRHQVRNLERSPQSADYFQELYDYLCDAQELLSHILDTEFPGVTSRLEVEEWSALLNNAGRCSLSKVDEDVLSCFGGHHAITQSAWKAWLTHVFDPSLEYESVEVSGNESFKTAEVEYTCEPIGCTDEIAVQADNMDGSDMMNYSLDRIDEMLESTDLFKLVSDNTY